MKILVTGAAGFIGFHLSRRLVQEGHNVTGFDNINDYYSTNLKYDRLRELGITREHVVGGNIVESMEHENFKFLKGDLENREVLKNLFSEQKFEVVINLAAQAGVRYSLEDPFRYIDSNIMGFLNILECARHYSIKHLIYASSSSVYGANTRMPFSTSDNVDHPKSLYAATKKSNELMAHSYSSLFDIPTTGLRFFTAYGPWGRPDMALFLFAKAMINNEPINVFNHGMMERDFTYIDDIVEGVTRLIPKPPLPDASWSGDNPEPATSFAPYQVFNIGNTNPVKLLDFIHEIEKQLGVKARKRLMDLQPGDVVKSKANVDDFFAYTNFKPQVGIEQGIKHFIDWYKAYFLEEKDPVLS